MPKVIYKGFFVDKMSSFYLKETEGVKRLEKKIKNEHVTFALHPGTLFPESFMGKTFTLIVVGYGNDGQNSGFEVALPKELMPYYKGRDTIHITTSLSLTGKAKDTAYLKFDPIPPFAITGQLGYYTGKDILFN